MWCPRATPACTADTLFTHTLHCLALLTPSSPYPILHHDLQPRVDVVPKGYSGLLDCLELYATSVSATLVVMGSQAMTSIAVAGGSSSSIGGAANSVTLSCVKRLQLPIVVVTANTRLAQVWGVKGCG